MVDGPKRVPEVGMEEGGVVGMITRCAQRCRRVAQHTNLHDDGRHSDQRTKYLSTR